MRLAWIWTAVVAAALAQEPQDPKPIDEGEATITAKEIHDHLEVLASDEMRGRLTGTDEAAKAAAYIADQLKKAGAQPAGTQKTYEQKFKAQGKATTNVCGQVAGSDGVLRREFLVFGAHYDHVGVGEIGSRAPERKGQVHNGADDNASGTAALLELAQAFAKKPARRSVLFLAFSGEELGLLGSKAWCKEPTVPLKSVAAMINLDMIGRSKDKYVFVGGLNTASVFEKLVREANKDFHFKLELAGGGRGPSDHTSFYDEEVPAIFFFTGLHDHYHTPDDDVALVNTVDEALIVRMAYRVGKKVADGPRPKWERDDREAMPVADQRGGDSAKATLGIALAPPAPDDDGVPIIGVTKGGAGSDAGLAVEDRIAEIDGQKITSPLQVNEALALKRPGSQLKLLVVRGRPKKRLLFTLKLKG